MAIIEMKDMPIGARKAVRTHQDYHLERDRGQKPVGDREDHDRQRRPGGAGELEESDGAEVADGATRQAPTVFLDARCQVWRQCRSSAGFAASTAMAAPLEPFAVSMWRFQ